MAIGYSNGAVCIYDIENRDTIQPQHSNDNSIVELQWNPGENLLLALHDDGQMVMYSPESKGEKAIMTFEKISTGIHSIGWLDRVSGDIVTSSNKLGALRLWNASKDAPKQMIKVTPHGIVCIKPFFGHS